MASELPRGATINNTQLGTGTAAQVTIPAAPGITHVLTSIRAKLADLNAGPGELTFFVQIVITGATTINLLIAAGIPGSDEVDFTCEIPAPAGGVITVAFNGATAANVYQEVTAQWHDI